MINYYLIVYKYLIDCWIANYKLLFIRKFQITLKNLHLLKIKGNNSLISSLIIFRKRKQTQCFFGSFWPRKNQLKNKALHLLFSFFYDKLCYSNFPVDVNTQTCNIH